MRFRMWPGTRVQRADANSGQSPSSQNVAVEVNKYFDITTCRVTVDGREDFFGVDMASYERLKQVKALPPEVLFEVLMDHQRIPSYRAPGENVCSCGHLPAKDGPNSPRHAAHVAEKIIERWEHTGG